MTGAAVAPRAPDGGGESCPYCATQVAPERAADARWVCAACGAVRVPGEQLARDPREGQPHATDEATVARTSAAVWRELAIVVSAFALFSALVVWLVMSVANPPSAANIVAFGGTLVPLGFAGYAWTQANARAREVPPAVERAWKGAVLDIVRQRQSIDAAMLASATHLTTAEAEQLLSALSRDSKLVPSDVAAGGTRYALPSAGSPAPGID